MKVTLIGRAQNQGFALPTVLIASVVMLIVLLAAISASASIRAALDSQYYNQIGREAVESGLTLATECLKLNPTPAWSDASPLRPGSSCNGSASESGYVIDTPTLKTSFTVGNYSTDADGRTTIKAEGIVNLRRTSSPTETVRTFDQSTTRFVQIVPLVTRMWGNAFHTCTLASKQIFCWGENVDGQLGDGTTTDHLTPQPIKYTNGLQAGTITDIGVGNGHSCALAQSKVWCWGDNQYGQLGDGTTTNRTTPVQVGGLIAGLTVQNLSVGAYGTCAIVQSRAYCWGWNPDGQVGDGTTIDRSSPTKVPLLINMDQIATDNYHTCIHTTANTVYCWGRNTSGQLGNGTTTNSLTPVQLTLPTPTTPLKEVGIGSAHTCVSGPLNGAGVDRLFCTGYNTEGGLGNGTTTNRTTVGATPIAGAMGTAAVTSFSLGGYQTCAVAASKVYCWGRNTDGPGQVGNNTSTNQLSPVAVTATGVLSGKTMTDVFASGQYTCAIDTQFAAYCWGRNDFGQLGNGTTTNSLVPVKVSTSQFKPIYTDF